MAVECNHSDSLTLLLSDDRITIPILREAVRVAVECNHSDSLTLLLSHCVPITDLEETVQKAAEQNLLGIFVMLLFHTRKADVALADLNTFLQNREISPQEFLRAIQWAAAKRNKDALISLVLHSELLINHMTISQNELEKNPVSFLNTFANRNKLPAVFWLLPLGDEIIPIDMGGVSSHIYSTLLSALVEQKAFPLEDNNFPVIPELQKDKRLQYDQNISQQKKIYTLLGSFYSKFVENNEGRSVPFVTGEIFSAHFFHLLQIVARKTEESCIDIKFLNYFYKNNLVSSYACCWNYLVDPTESNKDLVVSFRQDILLEEITEDSLTVEEFSRNILQSYIAPVVSFFEGVSGTFQGHITNIEPSILCTHIQGEGPTSEVLLNIIQEDHANNITLPTLFSDQMELLRSVIATASAEWRSNFLLAVTESKRVRPNLKITVGQDWIEKQDGDAPPRFLIRTCSCTLYLPSTTLLEEDFLFGLNNALDPRCFNMA